MHKKSGCWTMSRSNSHMSHMAIRKAGDKPPTIAKQCEAPHVSIINELNCTEKGRSKGACGQKTTANCSSLTQLTQAAGIPYVKWIRLISRWNSAVFVTATSLVCPSTAISIKFKVISYSLVC